MAALTQVPVQVYDVRGDTVTLPPSTVSQNRNPGINDLAEVGSMWVNYLTNSAFILTSTAGASATWTDITQGGIAGPIDTVTTNTGDVNPVAGAIAIVGDGGNMTVEGAGAGATVIISNNPEFATVTADAMSVVDGDLEVTNGNISASSHITAGVGLDVLNGDLVVQLGSIIAHVDLSTDTGNIDSGAAISAATTITAGTGIEATTGSIRALAGDLVSTNGGLVVQDNVVSNSGNLVAVNGTIELLTPGTYFAFPNNVQMLSGSGDPNGVVNAPQGSLYLNATGSGVADRAWINTNSGTVWTAISTIA